MLSCLEILGNESLVVTLPCLPLSFEEVSGNKKTRQIKEAYNFAPLLMIVIHMSTSQTLKILQIVIEWRV